MRLCRLLFQKTTPSFCNFNNDKTEAYDIYQTLIHWVCFIRETCNFTHAVGCSIYVQTTDRATFIYSKF